MFGNSEVAASNDLERMKREREEERGER